MALLRQIWIAQIMEMYLQSLGWMDRLEDMSQFVNNNTLNLAEAGVQPNVLVNNNTYPVPFAERTDNPHEIVLDILDTEGTVIRNARNVELSYDKMASVVKGHVDALLQMGGRRASHAISPASDDVYTPVVETTGADDGNARKEMTEDDVLTLAERFDAIDAPEGSRVLTLHPTHFNQLIKNSQTLKEQRYRSAEGNIKRNAFELFGFSIEKFRSGAVYNKSTGVKVAFGAAADPVNDAISSFAFVEGEVMKAIGEYEMFSRLNDPEEKGDIINFQQRFIAMPKRTKFIASIYSKSTV